MPAPKIRRRLARTGPCSPRSTDTAIRILVYTAFFLSGAAGLIYETTWSRYLGLFVGHGAYAQVIVLSIFMGGLSAGALITGRRSRGLARPIRWYVGAELLIAAAGLAFHPVFHASTAWAQTRLLPGLGAGATAAQWALAAALIAPQSVALGATFPLLSAGLVRRTPARSGHSLSLLYFSNGIGAAAGALLTAFVLIRAFGLPGALAVAAALNVGAALLAGLAERRDRVGAGPAPDTAASSPAVGRRTRDGRRLWRLLLAVSFGTALASFIYEITWIRMLSLVLGSASRSFDLMLSAFILGLALGALWIRSRADTIRRPLVGLGVIQWLMGAAAVATLPLYLGTFGWVEWLLATLAPTADGYRLYNVARYGMALAVMLPSTFLAGMTLPLITNTLLRSSGEEAIGWVYGVNTLGSIVGVALAGLVLMPLIGLETLLLTGAALDMAIGVALLAVAPGRRRSGAGSGGASATGAAPGSVRAAPWRLGALTAATVVVVVGVGRAVELDRRLLTSGVYRTGRIAPEGAQEVVFYEDGRTATVGVTRSPAGSLSLSTNGKPDASVSGAWLRDDGPQRPFRLDESTQTLLALISLAYVPGAERAAAIGQGSGMTSHFLLASPMLRSLETIEIEPAMIRGSRLFYPANRRVFDDPRSRFVIADARATLAASGRRYDLVVSAPSNPWVSGVASLFTEQFYRRVAHRLSDRGVFGQWLHLYEISDELVLSVLAAVHEAFGDYVVYQVNERDALIIASPGPLPAPDWSVLGLPDVRRDLRRIYPLLPVHLETLRFAGRPGLAPLLDDIGPNSDYRPILDVGAEAARYRREAADGILGLAERDFTVAQAFLPPQPEVGPGTPAPVPGADRLEALALNGWLRLALREPDEARRLTDDGSLLGPLEETVRFRRRLRSAASPEDWRSWLTDALAYERRLHGGLVGAVDGSVYTELRDAMARLGAPDPARHALALTGALRARRYPAAAASADSLAAATAPGDRWLDAELLALGGALPRLGVGDREGAARWLDRYGSEAGLTSSDLRVRLLRAHAALR